MLERKKRSMRSITERISWWNISERVELRGSGEGIEIIIKIAKLVQKCLFSLVSSRYVGTFLIYDSKSGRHDLLLSSFGKGKVCECERYRERVLPKFYQLFLGVNMCDAYWNIGEWKVIFLDDFFPLFYFGGTQGKSYFTYRVSGHAVNKIRVPNLFEESKRVIDVTNK